MFGLLSARGKIIVKQVYWKCCLPKWRPFCQGANELTAPAWLLTWQHWRCWSSPRDLAAGCWGSVDSCAGSGSLLLPTRQPWEPLCRMIFHNNVPEKSVKNWNFHLIVQKHPDMFSLYLIWYNFTCPGANLTGPFQFLVDRSNWASISFQQWLWPGDTTWYLTSWSALV